MGAPEGNKNAEIWTLKEATKFLDKATELSESMDYDFIGEVAKKLKVNKHTFTYLVDKYPELKPLYDNILGNIESNCFSNAKKGNIKEAIAIVNLKSNYGWTDRQQTNVTGEVMIDFVDD
jgi:hypothetical protein